MECIFAHIVCTEATSFFCGRYGRTEPSEPWQPQGHEEVSSENAYTGMVVVDRSDNSIGLIFAFSDLHNVEVIFPSGKGIYCLEKTCDDYHPLYYMENLLGI